MEKIKKIAKNLDVIARTADIVCGVFVWVLPICAALLLIFGEKVIADETSTVTLGMLCFEFVDGYIDFGVFKIRMIIGLLAVTILLVLVRLFIRVIRGVITPMKDGKPFEAAVSDKLRKLSWATLIGGGILSVAKMAGEIILYRVYDLGTVFLNEHIISCTPEFTLDMSFVVVFAVLYLLSYVFRYGEELQKQSDETL